MVHTWSPLCMTLGNVILMAWRLFRSISLSWGFWGALALCLSRALGLIHEALRSPWMWQFQLDQVQGTTRITKLDRPEFTCSWTLSVKLFMFLEAFLSTSENRNDNSFSFGVKENKMRHAGAEHRLAWSRCSRVTVLPGWMAILPLC